MRKFQEEKPLDRSVLESWIDLARCGGSARNGQVLKYMIVTDPGQRNQLFPTLAWAGYLKDWHGPEPGERPSGYIICLLDRKLLQGNEKEAYFDCGIATQSVLLAAVEQGVFGCRIGAFSPKLGSLLNLPEHLDVLLVLALGYPAEKVQLEQVRGDGDIRYWRDEEGTFHVPKRSLVDILVAPNF